MTQPARTAPTLAEVAEAAGVSRSTASRALNDSPRISEETKKRVRAAAKKINFVPNARGRHSPSDVRKLSPYWSPNP